MKRVIIGLMLCVFLIGIMGLVAAVPNPAPVYCSNMGYTSNETSCIFSDGNSCEIWSFYNGVCGQQYVKNLSCVEKGGFLSSGYKCCEGLASIPPISATRINNGICDFAEGWNICSPCGNGVCDSETENKCNCPQDCSSENEDKNQTNQGLGQIIRNRVHAGIYTSPSGEEIRVSEMAQNRIKLMVGNKSADCNNCNITEEKENNRTKLKIHLSNGSEKEIKIMPNKASERALEILKLKFCNDSNNCTIELKEVGNGNKIRASYEVQVERHYKLLGLFNAKALNKVQVDAETGDTIIVKKPWWAFLAKESD